jgi:hypothetical protein
VGLIAIPFAAGFWQVFHDMQASGHPNIGLVIGLVLPLLPIIFLLVVTAIALDIIMRDWMLPHFALEDASASEAWSSVWARIMAEKGQFLVYALLRLILPIVASIAQGPRREWSLAFIRLLRTQRARLPLPALCCRSSSDWWRLVLRCWRAFAWAGR